MSEEELKAAIYCVYEAGLRLKQPYYATRFMKMMEGPGGPLKDASSQTRSVPAAGALAIRTRIHA